MIIINMWIIIIIITVIVTAIIIIIIVTACYHYYRHCTIVESQIMASAESQPAYSSQHNVRKSHFATSLPPTALRNNTPDIDPNTRTSTTPNGTDKKTKRRKTGDVSATEALGTHGRGARDLFFTWEPASHCWFVLLVYSYFISYFMQG